MSNEPIFYVYVYLDPRKPGKYVYGEYEFEYEPFYVGKGKNKRLYDHLKSVGKNPYFSRKIKKIQNELGFDPIIIKYKEFLIENMSLNLEISMIQKIGRYNLKKGPLCNLTDGGEGTTGIIDTEETKIKKSKGHIGKKHTEETKQKQRNAKLGDMNPMKRLDVRKKNSESQKGENNWNYGKHLTEETKKKLRISHMKFSVELIMSAIKLREDNVSWRKIATITGMGKTTIRRWVEKYNNGYKI